MDRVRLEILPWISDTLGSQRGGRLVMEETVEEGSTIGDLMRKLGNEHQAFGKVVFDPETSKLSGYVAIALNDLFLEALTGMDTRIKDGDIIRLFPVIAGG